MRAQLASFTEQLSNTDWDLIVETGQGNLTAGSIELAVQNFNRVGTNFLSQVKNITWNNGDRLALTFNPTMVAPGEKIFKFIVSGQKTGTIQDSVQIAEVNYLLSDQATEITLPFTIYFSEDHHLETDNLEVQTINDFPANAINGELREVIAESNAIYMFNEDEMSWLPFYRNSPSTYLASTRDEGGADQALGAPLLIPLPAIDSETSPVVTNPITYWLVNTNDESEGLTESGNFNLRVNINGAAISSEGVFYGNVLTSAFKFQLEGYYRLLTRTLDTGISTVGVEQTWHPIFNLLDLPVPLPAGYAAVYTIRLEVDPIALAQLGIKQGDVISLGFDAIGDVGIPTPLAALTGNVIFGDGDRCLVLPPGQILAGAGIAGGFFFRKKASVQGILSSANPNMANQLVIINGATGGNVRVANSPAVLLSSENLRAKFSTEPGYGNHGEFSDVFSLTTSAGLEITVQHPVSTGLKASIRANYPDPNIAGNPNALWDNPSFRLFMIQGSTLYQSDSLYTSDSQEFQTIQIFNLDGFSVIPFIQNASEVYGLDFILYEPGKPTVSQIAGGALAANTYQFAIRYEYPSPNYKITRLRQDDSELIPTFKSTFADFLAQTNRWQDTVLTLTAARSLSFDQREPFSVWLIEDFNYTPYLLRLDLTAPDDGRNVIRFTEGIGGFIPLATKGFRIATNTELLDAYSILRVISPLTAAVDTAGASINVSLDLDFIPPFNIPKNMLASNGMTYISSDGRRFVL